MRPKKHRTTGSGDLFRARLDQIINMKHELVQLAGKVDWDWIDGEIAPLYSENGRPGIATRFVIGLLLLKHIYGLSDEGVCERWVHDPYFQYFTGEEFFQHAFPHERSDLSHWRKRLGDKLELLLAESLRVAHEAGALRSQDLKRVTVDTTVQPKAITFPTDAKLLHAAIKGLNRLARKHGVRLRQSYLRIAKTAAMMAGRYAHAKQFKRHQRQLRILRSRLGRIIRDIRRKIEGQAVLENAFALPLSRASQIRSQQQRQRGWKLYSFHAPEVECIGDLVRRQHVAAEAEIHGVDGLADLNGQDRLLDAARKLIEDRIDLGVDLGERLAGIEVQPQVDGDGRGAGLAGRRHVVDAIGLGDGVFQRRGDEAGDDRKIRAVVRGRHRDDRVLRAGILQDRQRRHRLQTQHQDHQADDDRKHRPTNEDVGKGHVFYNH